MSFHFFLNVHVDTIKKFFTTRACFWFYVIQFRKQWNIFCTSEALLCFTQKYIFFIMIKIKLILFIIQKFFFWVRMYIFILKIFFTMLHLKIFLEYCTILYIFRMSLCVKGPLHATIFWKYTELFNIPTIFSRVTW